MNFRYGEEKDLKTIRNLILEYPRLQILLKTESPISGSLEHLPIGESEILQWIKE